MCYCSLFMLNTEYISSWHGNKNNNRTTVLYGTSDAMAKHVMTMNWFLVSFFFFFFSSSSFELVAPSYHWPKWYMYILCHGKPKWSVKEISWCCLLWLSQINHCGMLHFHRMNENREERKKPSSSTATTATTMAHR